MAVSEREGGSGGASAGVSPKGNVKVTREEWIEAAQEALIARGIDHVKILELSERLQVSRSSFYWYFKGRKALLDALLDAWGEENTGSFVAACDAPAETITESVCNLFRCFVDVELFDPQLDFAIRDWSRRAPEVRRFVDEADAARLAATTRMFQRHGYADDEAETRARVLYYMQLGYYALELKETIEERLARVPGYLEAFTGQAPRTSEVDALRAYSYAIIDATEARTRLNKRED